ncbi:MAG TPA: CHAP domain-containing protein [Nitrospira sp.]|jgi:hypothetical protein|nr:CHAP domain-containing protein [Nitrospira sp.]
MPILFRTLRSFMLLATLTACAAPSSQVVPSTVTPIVGCCRLAAPDSRQQAIVRTAVRLVGAKTIESNGRRIAYDCAGVMRAIYLAYGIDLYQGTEVTSTANGVRLIYNHLRSYGRLHLGPIVRAGDLVFFDNTWDSNGDGQFNDPLTHVGIVEMVEDDGTVIFISRLSGAIERYRMNVARPHLHRTVEGKVLNDYLRRKHWRDGEQTAYLTGELFAAFGTRVLE